MLLASLRPQEEEIPAVGGEQEQRDHLKDDRAVFRPAWVPITADLPIGAPSVAACYYAMIE